MKEHHWPVKRIDIPENMRQKIEQCAFTVAGEFQLAVTPENRAVWLELIQLAESKAVNKYQQLNPGVDIRKSISARIWLKGFQVGYLGNRIGSCIGIEPGKQKRLDKQVERILFDFYRESEEN